MDVKKLCRWCQGLTEGEDPHCSESCAHLLHTGDQLLNYLNDLLLLSRNRLEDLTVLLCLLSRIGKEDEFSRIETHELSDKMATPLRLANKEITLSWILKERNALSEKIVELERDVVNVEGRLT